MKHEELMKDVHEVAKEIETKGHKEKKSSFVWLWSLILGFLIILMVVPYYGVKLDPEPKYIPQISEVIVVENTVVNTGERRNVNSRDQIRNFLEPNNPRVKNMADRILSLSGCPEDRACYAKALFYFVRDRIGYVNDPPDEYIKPFEEMVSVNLGDCDDKSLLLANLLQSVGIYTRFVFVPNHVYVTAYIPDSLKKYHDSEQYGWINLDPTCNYCGYGDIARSYVDTEKVFV